MNLCSYRAMTPFDHRRIIEKIYKEKEDFLNVLLEQRGCTEGEFYDRMKQPITPAEWIILRDECDYYLIAEEFLGNMHVYTEWHGYNPPFIFRTQICYAEQDGDDIILYPQMRIHYADEISAMRGHNKMVFCIDQNMFRVVEIE
jgi:hypothetical protein